MIDFGHAFIQNYQGDIRLITMALWKIKWIMIVVAFCVWPKQDIILEQYIIISLKIFTLYFLFQKCVFSMSCIELLYWL